MQRAAERGDAPAKALELKELHDDPIFIDVRFAGDRAPRPHRREVATPN